MPLDQDLQLLLDLLGYLLPICEQCRSSMDVLADLDLNWLHTLEMNINKQIIQVFVRQISGNFLHVII
jgi:hypothetical protein